MRRFSIRQVLFAVALAAVVPLTAAAQFKSAALDKPSVSESILRNPTSDSWFNLFDPSRLSMHHTFSLSYSTFGGGRGMSMGMYTNSLAYKISDPLDVQFDVSLMYSPSSSIIGGPQKDFSGIYLTRAQLNYRPSKNMLFQVNFQQLPMASWFGGYSMFSPMYDFGLPRTQEGN